MSQDAILSTEPRLGDLILNKPGKTGASKPTEVVSFLGMEDVSENGEILASHLLPLSSIKKGLTYFEKDDVLVAKITPCFENGKGANLELLKTNRGYGSTEFHVLRAKRDASAKYIFYHTQSVAFRKTLESEMIGTAGQKRVPLTAIMKYQLPVAHSYAEQQAIAAALGEMDALLAAQRARLAKQRAVKQGLLQGLLSGKQRLPGFAGEWEVKRLGEILKFQVGSPFSSTYFNQAGDGLRLIKNRDLKSEDSIYYYSGPFGSEFIVQNDDVLIGMDGDFLPCLWNKGKALLNQRVGRVVTNSKADRTFCYYVLAKPLQDIQTNTGATTVKHLSHKDIESISLPLPEITEQRAIAAVLSEADAYLAALEAEHAKTQLLKQGMMQNLLTGKLRLV